MYGYVYITTNFTNNKKYIGMHKSSEFTESYKGSGKILKQAIEKYGWNNFKVELIDKADTLEELSQKEAYWIDFYNAISSPNFYNIKQGGFGGYQINGVSIKRGRKMSERARLNTSLAHMGHKHSKETREKMSKSRLGSKNGFYGKTFSEEVLKHLSEVRRDKCWVNDGVSETTIFKDQLDKYLSSGYVRGRLYARGKHK